MIIRMLALIAGLSLSGAPVLAEHHEKANDTGNKQVETESKKGAGDNVIAPDKKTATEKVGDAVPEMKSDAKPAKESTAPDTQTYTDKVGEAVPDMKAPDNKKQ